MWTLLVLGFSFCSPDLRLWIPNDGGSRELKPISRSGSHTGLISAGFRKEADKLGLFFFLYETNFCRLIGFLEYRHFNYYKAFVKRHLSGWQQDD